MRALVLGKGKSGAAAGALLREQGYEVDFAEGYDLVAASPGMAVRSELQIGCEELKRRGWKLLAITGSKGKSSVVKLVAEALNGIPCGNYGTPVSEVAKCEAVGEKWAVVEVSSFQLETTNLPPETFEAAAILNLQEDHLDRHGGVAAYHAAKRRLLTMTRLPIDGTRQTAQGVAAARKLFEGTYFDNEVLAGNGSVAVELMRAAGLDDGRISAAFATFKPLPHRMEEIAVIGGVRYVDDSKATSIAALTAGVRMCGGAVRLIAGGLPKGDEPKMALPTLTERVKKVYLIGQSAEGFRSAWKESVNCEVCVTMERAVEAVMREAVKGETVILSPGSASFDQFKSFEERGEVFASLVKKGKKE